jgi:hypothetical protein
MYRFASLVGILMLCAFTLLPPRSFAELDKGSHVKLRVGAVGAPPFAMKTAGGAWEGLSKKEIASRLHIATETIKTHVRNIYRKPDAKGRMAALKAARM